MDTREESYKGEVPYSQETEQLILDIATQTMDEKEKPLTVQDRLIWIHEAREQALNRMVQVGQGGNIAEITDRLHLLTALKNKIFRSHPDAKRIQRRLVAPHRSPDKAKRS
jgi:hypothetical protein